MANISFKDIFAPSFWQAWNDFLNHKYTDMWFAGGRGSTKSSFVSMCILLGLIRDSQEAALHYKRGDKKWKSYLTHAIVYRKIAADLRGSVYNQMAWSLEKLGLIDKFKFNMSPLRITYKATGQMIDFKGLDDPLKSKSIKAPFGYYKYNWFEELDQFDGIEEIRSVLQSLRRGGHMFSGFFSYNPPEVSNCWVNVEAAEDVPSRHVYRSDYRSVPKTWLGDTFFQEAEDLRRINERAYRHEYLGEVTGNGGAVFENIVDLEMSDEMISQFDSIHIGADFGFARDPAFVTFSHYDRKRGDIYCFKELCETNLTNPQLAEKIKAMEPGYNYIMCDSAEPKSIQELEDCGINALGVVKSGDSRRFSYKWLQARAHIYIDKRRCPNLYKQMILCEYLKNRAGQFISRYPENGGDDGIDSLRYAYMEDATGAGLV